MQPRGQRTSDLTQLASQDFWDFLDRLVKNSQVVIDRPKGSHHPRYIDLIYPLDYGYLANTAAMDGGGIDVWIGSRQPRSVEAVIVTIDVSKRDAEIKVLLGCTQAEEQVALAFLNDGSMRAVLVPRRTRWQEFLRSRRSIRRFENRPVPPDVIERVLQAATWAPSAHNRQPWRFVVLSSQPVRDRFAQAMGADFRRDLLADGLSPEEADAQVERSRRRILEAPVLILLCLDLSTGDTYTDAPRQLSEVLMGVQGVAMAGENLLLAAHAEGLGGVWVCAPLFAQETVIEALDLPESWLPQGMVLLGYPARKLKPSQPKPLDEITRYL